MACSGVNSPGLRGPLRRQPAGVEIRGLDRAGLSEAPMGLFCGGAVMSTLQGCGVFVPVHAGAAAEVGVVHGEERGDDGPSVVRLKDGQGLGLYRVQSAGDGSGGPWADQAAALRRAAALPRGAGAVLRFRGALATGGRATGATEAGAAVAATTTRAGAAAGARPSTPTHRAAS